MMGLAILWHGLSLDLLRVRIMLTSQFSNMLTRRDVRLSCIRLMPGISWLSRFRSSHRSRGSSALEAPSSKRQQLGLSRRLGCVPDRSALCRLPATRTQIVMNSSF